MEREVREIGRGRRGGGEKRKGIIVGGVILGLLMGCNNGEIEKLEKNNKFLSSVVNLGSEFLNVFTSFGEMVGDILVFNEKTTKSKVGDYFKKVKKTVEGAKDKLNTMVENMKSENNPNASKTEGAITDLNKKLDEIISGASEAIKGAEGDELLGDMAAHRSGGTPGTGVVSLVKGIKNIVDIVLKNEGKHDAGNDLKAENGNARSNAAGEAGKLFGSAIDTAANAKKSAADAAKAVGAVTGADILKAIVTDGGEGSTKAANASAKDGTIAGAIALRAMVKGGKFANANDSDATDAKKIIEGAAVSAVTKALDTLTIAIRKTIDEGLKGVKEAMKMNPEDTPVTTEAKN